MLSRTLNGIAKMTVGMALLSMVSVICGGNVQCQTPTSPSPDPKEMHGGIEIALRVVRSIAIRVSTSSDGEKISIEDSDQDIPSTPFPRGEKLTPEYIRDLVQSAQKLSEKMQRDFGVPSHQIYLIGLSELGVQNRDELAREVYGKIGKEITFLDAKSETELNIASNIPRRYLQDGKWYDNRSASLLLDIGATNVRGGYQQMRVTSRGRTEYDYVTWDIPIAIKGLLRAEATQNPGLMMRKNVYLTGNIVWALATLLYPGDQEPYVSITLHDINNFHFRAMADPESLLNPDLSRIRDENVRKEARKGREAIKSIYTARMLTIAAEDLRSAVTELKLTDKRLTFFRNSNLTRLHSFVRLQIDR
ncbi:MAG: hypothetical protein ACREA2_00425 [Blastocatellia bacterium]